MTSRIPVDRTREVKTAQIWAMAFAAMYYMLMCFMPAGLWPLAEYAYVFMLFSLVCLIPSLFAREGRDPRRTDRVLGLIFLLEFVLMSLWQLRPWLLTEVQEAYTGVALVLTVMRVIIHFALSASVVGCFLARSNAAKWVLLGHVILVVSSRYTYIEPNNPEFLEMMKQATEHAQEWEATGLSVAPEDSVVTLHAVHIVRYPNVWVYGLYVTALVYAFLLRRKRDEAAPQARDD